MNPLKQQLLLGVEQRAWQSWLGSALVMIFAVLCAHAGQTRSAEIAVILSENASAYQELANTLRSDLERAAPERFSTVNLVMGQLDQNQIDMLKTEHYQMIVTVGTRAAGFIDELPIKAPVLHTLVPRAAVERTAQARIQTLTARRSAIWLDQPLQRQLELVRMVMPNLTRIGVVYGPESLPIAPQLERVAAALGLRVEAETIAQAGELGRALQRVLERSDLLLALPDPEVFNKTSVHNVLLSAYRNSDPVFAFSPAYVRAGALAAVYSSTEQIGRQAAEIIANLPGNGGALPEPQYPKYFSVAVNVNVARSLGIVTETETVLQTRLQNAMQAR